MLIPVDAGYSTEAEPIRVDVAVNQTSKSEDQHMSTNKNVGLDVHKGDTQLVIADDVLCAGFPRMMPSPMSIKQLSLSDGTLIFA